MQTPSRQSGLPAWVTPLDVLAVVMALITISVAFTGGFRLFAFDLRLSVTDWVRPALLTAIVIAIRHAIIRRQPLPRRIASGVTRWWQSPDTRVVLPIHFSTRFGVLLVGFLAVLLVGFPPEAANRWRIYNNELLDLPARWDAGWYLGIATEGYSYAADAAPQSQQNIAFFPAFPIAIRYASVLFGRQVLWTGVIVSIVSFFIALTYCLRLARDLLKDEQQAVTAITLLAMYPFAVFFSAAYTEAMFLVTMLGAVYHFHRNELWRAAIWGFICGLTRPNGAFLSVVLALMAIAPPRPSGALVRKIVAAGSPGYGMLAYSAFIYFLTGDPLMWARQNVAWGRVYRGLDSLVADRFDFIASNGLYSYAATQTIDMFYLLAVALCLAAVWPVYRRFGIAFAVLILITILPPMAAGGFLSMGRVTSILFPVFLWLGAVIPPQQRSAWIAWFALLQGFVAVMFFTWRPLF